MESVGGTESEAPSCKIEHLENDSVVQEVLQNGTDLRQYSRQVEKELKEVENKSIQDYIKESQNIVSLHNQIAACDDILERMESMLQSFQSDLGSISNEILSLQQKSCTMSQHLHNRQAIRGQLNQFIEEMVVSDSLISIVNDTPVTDKEFLAQLKILNHKLSFVRDQSTKEVRACQDVKDVLEKLKIKAVIKIRAYLLEQISKFRKPMTNYQIPQNAILKFKFFYEFVLTHERAVAMEVCTEYVNTMSKVYYSYFNSYSSELMKLQYDECATKHDLMGTEDSAKSALFSKNSTYKQKSTIFSIGNRGEVLTSQLEAPIIVPHSAHKNDARYPFEAIFRSLQYALVDNACREYLFLGEFFMLKPSSALNIFSQVMDKTLNLLFKNLETYVDHCYDTIALFLCAHLAMRYQLLCHKRAVPALDQYWDLVQACIWPRFEFVFQLNIKSIKNCDPWKFNKEMKPHYIARRYAEYSSALIEISEEFPHELVTKLLAQLLEETHCFLLRMAAIFTTRKEQLIFLINNYDLIITTLMERTRENSKEVDNFRANLHARNMEFAEEILSPHFGGMIQYVKEEEMSGDKKQSEEMKKLENKQLAIVQPFVTSWKKSLDSIRNEVLSSFPNLVTGANLLQLTLTQFVEYYHRFLKLISLNARNQIPNIHYMMVEIKKYKTNFN
ncbi:unnamed protein product [Bemisia tabaci]|uniref:Vacuolar protein sorting-associated protein 52 homolog n=1 Tax=Bemisia tabaci TaxID=7038 RepID=A0A9P0F8N8_BEMTA|nr:unnamed protein product [Bemisia tabaci]